MNLTTREELQFTGRLVMIGFGCIGQGVLPLLLRHIDMSPGQITLLSVDSDGADIARAFGVNTRQQALTAGNLRSVLQPMLGRGDFLLNVSVKVSSIALIELCQRVRRPLSGHLHRTLVRRLHRRPQFAGRTHQLRPARGGAGVARPC